MKVTSSRRPSTRRSTSLYSRPRQESPQKIYDQTSDVSELESDESASEEDEEETNKLEDATYQSEEDEMEEDQDMIEEELEEEEENEHVEEPEEDIEEEIEQIEDDIDVEVEEIIDDGDDATPVDDEEDFEAEEDSDEVEEDEDEDDEGQSDYEEEIIPRKTRGGAQRSQQVQQGQQQPSPSLKGKIAKIQPEKQPASRKRGSIAEPSSSHGHRILTKRQRAKLNENYQQDLLQLPMEPMKKKHMTEEEIALKKSEIARRRKHQSIQRAEQDKMDTINRLLKKQTTKRRTKDQDDTDSIHNDLSSSGSLSLSSYHYVNNVEGSTLSIPAGVKIPIQSEKGPKYPPPVPDCAFPGCNVPKKYCSVKTFEYACSMDHLHKLESKG